MWHAGSAFLERSSRYLTHDYFPRVRVAVEALPRGDLWWRPNDASNSVGNLLMHLAGNLRQWVVHGVGGVEDVRRRDEEFDAAGGATADELLDRLRASVREAAATLDGLDPGDLSRRVTIQGIEGTALDAIYHAVEHFSMHTGQILWIVKSRTGEDLGLYRIGEDGTAETTWDVG